MFTLRRVPPPPLDPPPSTVAHSPPLHVTGPCDNRVHWRAPDCPRSPHTVTPTQVHPTLITPTLVHPTLFTPTQVHPGKVEVAAALVSAFEGLAVAAIAEKGRFTVAVPGGSVLKMLSGLTQSSAGIDWTKVRSGRGVWGCEERKGDLCARNVVGEDHGCASPPFCPQPAQGMNCMDQTLTPCSLNRCTLPTSITSASRWMTRAVHIRRPGLL